MWDQLAILWTPLEYCNATVFPVMLYLLLLYSSQVLTRTDIGKLPVLEDQEIMLDTQFLQEIDHRTVEIFKNIDMGLERR